MHVHIVPLLAFLHMYVCLYVCNQSINQSIIVFEINIYTGGWPLINMHNNGTQWSLNGEQFIQEKLLGSPAFFALTVYVSPTDVAKNNIYVRFSEHKKLFHDFNVLTGDQLRIDIIKSSPLH